MNFHERADFHVIADFATIEVDKIENAHVPTQLDIRRNSLN